MGFIIIYITYPNLKIAKKIVTALMESRLIACGNFFPIQNTYWWKGKIENSKEVVSIVKTKKKNWEKVKSAIIKLHPYKTPCIMKINVEAGDDYESWINKEVK
ncbi:MAG TPA: divalent-cation tolerance protein CutA [Candidatus Magasanikbacteria bacterium]|uniref:CutA1 divalent ion tolerance protein n=2 Tax=Candidatus Magasanikiibacteriota TaxID=1752731 RepID=A0A0G0ZID1_9BACT|nr:MAG: CutA1 divalent ion tolerance protein [Candidatus Magasanikbacteria bacterium GW2011_GWC2_41_17]KKS12753.1 MAG: CutA1 divalent ion tolerance protein [Candidatus Magasanikbacteria bacterium GW2011_GWA2_41_55]HBV57751.1 divalent-cation tolerance protein CutA [Candidatus Magasanikbacteria bacterium]HBX15730.1 divalent-cation tolerance protein CutA [Candidatus Magasanikbacteria bacterium]